LRYLPRMEPRIIFKLKRRLIMSFRQGPTMERRGRRIVLVILNRTYYTTPLFPSSSPSNTLNLTRTSS